MYSVISYCAENEIVRLNIAHDGSQWASTYVSSIIAPLINKVGFNTAIVNHPATVSQISWLPTQLKHKSLSIYLSRNNRSENKLGIYFFDDKGSPLTEKALKAILRYPAPLKIEIVSELVNESLEYIDLDSYLEFLIDKKRISEISTGTATINIDLMFGAFENIGLALKRKFNNSITLYNLCSDPPRLLNYIAKPTGNFLKWYTSVAPSNRHSFFCGMDGDGDSIGIYDTFQGVELNQNSIVMLLLRHLSNTAADKGKVIVVLSKALSERVTKYAKKLGFSVKQTDKYLYSIAKYKAKEDSYVFYADEYGRFYFNEEYIAPNPIITLFNIVELCTSEKKSPGEIIDEITTNVLKTQTFTTNFFIPKNYEIYLDIVEQHLKDTLNNIKDEKIYEKLSVFNTDTGVRILVKDDPQEEFIEIVLEADSRDNLIEVSTKISGLISAK